MFPEKSFGGVAVLVIILAACAGCSGSDADAGDNDNDWFGDGKADNASSSGGWIGTPCSNDEQCAYSSGGRSGFCHLYKYGNWVDGGMCSLTCEGLCPDRDGASPTFCIKDGNGGGMCVIKAGSANNYCTDLPGTTSMTAKRFTGDSDLSSKQATVCLPENLAGSATVSCEELFFNSKFNANNKEPSGYLDLESMRKDTLQAVRTAVDQLHACGADEVTLGGMLSLLYYESGLQIGFYNTDCGENSYTDRSDCYRVAEALYSYQLGLGGMHLSNFHPCNSVHYTGKMRGHFLDALSEAGFSTDDSLITTDMAERFDTICSLSSPTPNAVDYYVLGAHDVFGIPEDGRGNYLEGHGSHPLLTPTVSVKLSFAELLMNCRDIRDDRDAIEKFGGADASYGEWSTQTKILSAYKNFSRDKCD